MYTLIKYNYIHIIYNIINVYGRSLFTINDLRYPFSNREPTQCLNYGGLHTTSYLHLNFNVEKTN